MIEMHALPLLAAFVDPYAILFRQFVAPPTHVRFDDEPNSEARLLWPARSSDDRGPRQRR
jgi:hypothetical protein